MSETGSCLPAARQPNCSNPPCAGPGKLARYLQGSSDLGRHMRAIDGVQSHVSDGVAGSLRESKRCVGLAKAGKVPSVRRREFTGPIQARQYSLAGKSEPRPHLRNSEMGLSQSWFTPGQFRERFESQFVLTRAAECLGRPRH